MSQPEQPLLALNDVNLTYVRHGGMWGKAVERVHALRGISFHLDAGETLALVGESGCGKSTTARCIVNLSQPDSGTIHFQGQELTTMNRRERRETYRHLQMVFQDPFASLNPRHPIRFAVAEPLLNFVSTTRRNANERADRLLERVGIPATWGHRYPHELSGGQRQRIGIARAIALDPQLVICDEAVSALDVSIQAQILELLQTLQQERNLSYLFISHDLAVVKQIAHRVCVMQAGQIIEQGSVADVYSKPQQAYTRQLLAAVPRLPAYHSEGAKPGTL